MYSITKKERRKMLKQEKMTKWGLGSAGLGRYLSRDGVIGHVDATSSSR
jgi:hypothetical protein